MFANYLKIIFRNLKKHKAYSLINIFGLAIGLAASLLIFLWVQSELQFDAFHSNANRICRIIREDVNTPHESMRGITSPPLAPAMRDDFAEIEMSSRFASWSTRNVRFGNRTFIEHDYYFVDPEFLRMFNFAFYSGDPHSALSEPNSVLLTQKTARKYFGEQNPIGKTMTIDDRFNVTVTGVVSDIPKNSTIYFDILSPYSLFVKEIIAPEDDQNWDFNMLTSFIMLSENTDVGTLNRKLEGYLQRYIPENNNKVTLQPFQKIHLYSAGFDRAFENLGDIKYIWIFSSLAFFIILIACLNYMNLATAQAGKRAREVGIRKTLGANRRHLILQFIGESMFIIFIAFHLGIALVELVLSAFNGLTGKDLALSFFENTELLLGAISICFFTGILSVLYPAIVLSAFKPIRVLKGHLVTSRQRIRFRHFLVILQFFLSSALIIGTLTISRQLQYIRNKDLGFQKDCLLQIRLGADQLSKYDLIKSELLRIPGVDNVTASLALPTNNANTPGCPDWEGKDPDNHFEIRAEFVDYDYIESFGIKIVDGRSFNRQFATDDSIAYVVNETAVRAMKLDHPVGKAFSFWGMEGQIIGVMKDFHFRPLHTPIEPMVFKIYQPMFRRVILKIDPANVTETTDLIKKSWQQMLPGAPFEVHFLDEAFENLYASEEQLGQIFRVFSVLAIFIACLGLLGLVSFIAEQKTKEIGVRKVLGASIPDIFKQFALEFTKWVLLANILSWPIIYLFMRRWLHGFAYHISFSLWMFLLSTAMVVTIAIFTISFQSIRAATANPVDSLRYE